MDQLLQEAFERAAALPQAESEDLPERLADDVLSEHRAGRTVPLNLEEL